LQDYVLVVFQLVLDLLQELFLQTIESNFLQAIIILYYLKKRLGFLILFIIKQLSNLKNSDQDLEKKRLYLYEFLNIY